MVMGIFNGQWKFVVGIDVLVIISCSNFQP